MTDKKDQDNIRAIRPDVCISEEEKENPTPNEQVVTLCETLLSLSKEGYLQELNYTAGYITGEYDSGSLGDCNNDDGICAEMMRMAMARTQMGMMMVAITGDDFDTDE